MKKLVWLELEEDSAIGVEPTTVELFQAAFSNVDDYTRGVGPGPSAAGREFALSKTATEDAIMRFNRGMAEMRGTRRDFDFEKEHVLREEG